MVLLVQPNEQFALFTIKIIFGPYSSSLMLTVTSVTVTSSSTSHFLAWTDAQGYASLAPVHQAPLALLLAGLCEHSGGPAFSFREAPLD